MFKEASRAYEDIKATRKEIDDAKKEGRDTTELEKILEVQVNTVKRINETNKKWSEKSKETSKQQEAIKEVEQAAVDAANEGEREYIIVGGKPYFKDDYAEIAGTRTGKGNYPKTFEEYAKAMDVDVLNTKDSPLSNELDEVTVTAERIDPPVSKEDVVPVQAGGVDPVKRSEEEESAALNTDSYYEHLLGAEGGKTSDPNDNAANVPGNADAPLDPSDPKGKRRFHTNKGLQYAKFKEWAKENNIPESKWQDRFLNPYR